ncbi:MAG: aminotransferase class I/II-fold pyridoxal phosphate-dependent enzyme, partial [Paludibacteraceae bacterium]|nr:aminotransferase class I/II-fold pyridoxal phosphate-dependent enzyme [Paludibacteraceae bacterium]
LAATAALQNEDTWHESMNIELYSKRRAVAEKIMDTLGCSYSKEQVGMFVWGKIPDSLSDVEQLTETILHKARVFITPGFIFGSNGARYIRISLCATEEMLTEALERVRLSVAEPE